MANAAHYACLPSTFRFVRSHVASCSCGANSQTGARSRTSSTDLVEVRPQDLQLPAAHGAGLHRVVEAVEAQHASADFGFYPRVAEQVAQRDVHACCGGGGGRVSVADAPGA